MEDKKQTKAMLIVKLNGNDTLYHMLYASQARQYGFDSTSKGWSAKDIFHAFILFDYEIFGHKKFKITENRLLGTIESSNLIKITSVTTPTQVRLQTIWEITVTTTYIVCHSCGQQQRETSVNTSMSNCCNVDYFEVPVTYWYNDEDDEDWGWYTPEGFEEGGGGPCPGCSWEDINPCELDEQGHATSFCNDFWEPIITLPPYNPLGADTVGIDEALALRYPCTAEFIRDSLTNINFNVLAQLAGAGVFKDSAYMHLTFDTSTVYTNAGQPAGETETTVSPFLDDDGITTFSAVIHLNGWYLRNATKEKMISTLVHESMHAIFRLRWGQYVRWRDFGQGLIDSNWLKAHYPSHWYGIAGQTRPLSELQDHEIMASDYINMYKNIMQQFWNPAASSVIRDSVLNAMAYGGLTATTIWKALPSHGIDTCKYDAIRISAERSQTSSYGVPGCGTYNYHYSDSLKLRPSCN